MFSSIIQTFWPSINKEEVKKFSLLSLTLACLIGSYWTMRLVKDVIMFKIAFPESLGWAANQGSIYQPIAKMWSVVVIFLVVAIYNILVSKYKKNQLFYIVCGFYGTLFSILAAVLILRAKFGEVYLGWLPLAIVGWMSYFSIESFGSICIPLFWSFTISTTSTESAKSGFPMIVAGAQIGAISGCLLVVYNNGSIWPLVILSSFMISMVPIIISYFIKVIPAHLQVSSKAIAAEEKKEEVTEKKEGIFKAFYEGIKLLFTRSYLIGVLGISTLYEIVGTIIDYQMKTAGSAFYSTSEYTAFLGWFGVATNGLAFVMALLGTSFMIKKMGLRFCLLFYPVSLALSIVAFLISFKFGALNPSQILAAIFSVNVLCKGLSYAVNNPSKEMMYIPTSKEVKYKAKSWIETFGSRGSKAIGGSISSKLVKGGLDAVMVKGNFIGLSIIGLWTFVAFFVGNKNAKLIRDNKIIE